MPYIKVNHRKLESTAKAIDTYVSSTKKRMQDANRDVHDLASSWQGEDFSQFKAQWNKTMSDDSTYVQMIKALESYSRFLQYAAGEYKKAQASAVNRANKLPRW